MKKETDIVFTGDIGFDHYMDGRWTDENLVSGSILDFIRSADHVVANVEGAMIEQERAVDTSGKGIAFHTMDPAAISFLKLIKADIWNIANNHAMDAGPGGIENTIAMAKSMGSKTIGGGLNLADAMKPVVLDEAGGIGILGCGYMPSCIAATDAEAGTLAWTDLDHIKETIGKIQETCRWAVVVVHGGEEFSSLPAPYTRALYHKYLELGADIVIGHHPHVPMNYETVGNKIIFYSLGNFVFDTGYQRAQLNTDTGILMKLSFTEDSWSFEPLGFNIVRGPEILVEGDLPDIFADIQEEEYNKLIHMAALAFLCNEKRRAIYLTGTIKANATEEEIKQLYASIPVKLEYEPGQHHDLAVYDKIADELDEAAFESSKLEKVKEYLLRQVREGSPFDREFRVHIEQ